MGGSARVVGRRVIVIGFVLVQVAFVVRAYWAPHREFGYQMFPEASQWQAEIVRVTNDGREVPIRETWAGYDWNDLAWGRGLGSPWRRHHADSGIERQLAFLDEALAWVADNTPDDVETRFLEAEVTIWHNDDPAATRIVRSPEREVP